MPNTLVHLGLQGAGCRLVKRNIDLKWVLLGCVIPDLPWILRRIIVASGIPIDSYDLRMYTVVQASLLFCLLLSAAFAVLSAQPRFVFVILSLNSLIHLLLDSLEKKWGNGVHLFAPFDWHVLSLDWIWPDSVVLLVLTAISLLLVISWFLKHGSEPVRLKISIAKTCLSVLIIGLYLTLPFLLKQGPFEADVNSVATLQQQDSRVGKLLYMDREAYVREDTGDFVVTFAGEKLQVTGDLRASKSVDVTLVAEFVGTDTISILRMYEFDVSWRGPVTMLGLLLVLVYWFVALWREYKFQITKTYSD